MIKRKLGFGHLGAGIVVWDSLNIECGDYETVALIGSDRKVSFKADLSAADKKSIVDFARYEDPRISSTQEAKVFRSRPEARNA